MRRNLIPIFALFTVIIVTPIMPVTASKTPFTAAFTYFPDVDQVKWFKMTKSGVYQIRDALYPGYGVVTIGDDIFTCTIEYEEDVTWVPEKGDLYKGYPRGTMILTFDLDDSSGGFEARYQYWITLYQFEVLIDFTGKFVGHGWGAFMGYQIMGTLANHELIDEENWIWQQEFIGEVH